MKFPENRLFHRAYEKMNAAGYREIHFYTIPSGFKNNDEMIEYWKERGCQAQIIDTDDGYGILHVSW